MGGEAFGDRPARFCDILTNAFLKSLRFRTCFAQVLPENKDQKVTELQSPALTRATTVAASPMKADYSWLAWLSSGSPHSGQTIFKGNALVASFRSIG